MIPAPLPNLKADPAIFKDIDNKNVLAVELFLKSNDINGKYGKDSLTLLNYAISTSNRKMVKFLLNAGADPNITDSEKNTSLLYAARTGDLRMIKILLRNGAWLNHKNKKWLTAYDVAVRHHHAEASRYLKARYERDLPPFSDGPYVSWKNRDKIKAFYLVHDSVNKRTDRITKKFKTESVPFTMPGFTSDTNHYVINKEHNVTPSIYKNIDRLLILGDIHGGYDSLILFLFNNQIVDKQLRWIFGNGHVVFLGDIFDRGDKVTESLWLIYHLEQQAMKAGGAVHYILGNHEVLALMKDHRFITDKYYYLCEKLHLTYGNLFAKNTVLGDWLRTKNSMIIIDDKLFVHAGISSDILKLELSPDELNEMVRYFLKYPDRNRIYGLEMREIIMGMRGLFWYRGFIETQNYQPPFTPKVIEDILNKYNVSYIYVGHSNVDTVSVKHDNRVFMLDVPFYNYGFRMQALLIESNTSYILYSNGRKKPFL